MPLRRKFGRAMAVSLAIHAAGLAILIFAVGWKPAIALIVPDTSKVKFVFQQSPGPGGGGGGNPRPAAARETQVPQHQPTMMPVPSPVAPPLPTLDAPVVTDAASLLQASGIAATLPPGPGGGTRGTGLGPGEGPGAGPGTGGGCCDGAYQVGSGVTGPTVILAPEPKYTSEAMRARIQGDVEITAIVMPNGTVGAMKISRSLDPQYGLDQEALKAAKHWMFLPGTKQGQAVPVVVTLILSFRLH